MIKYYKVGDIVWYWPNGYDILIKCKITAIDDFARKTEPQGYLFYDLDEPINLSSSKNELYSSFEDALDYFCNIHTSNLKVTLEEFRKRVINFVSSTWGATPEDRAHESYDWYMSLPNKIRGVDWFNSEDFK